MYINKSNNKYYIKDTQAKHPSFKTYEEAQRYISNYHSYVSFCYSYVSSKRLSYNTIRDYKSIIRTHIEPFFKDTLICDLNEHLFISFVDTLNANIDKTFVVLKITLDRLYKTSRIPKNYYSYLEKPFRRNKRNPKKALTPKQVSDFLGYFNGHHIEPLMYLMFYSGCRLGEALALQWNDIEYLDDTSLVLHIGNSYSRTSSGYQRTSTKTTTSIRDVYISHEYLVKLLQAKPKTSKWVFKSTTSDKPYDPNNVNRRYFKKVSKEVLGFPISSHYCRVNYISYLLAKGIPIKTIEQQVGHANSSMILNVYAKALRKPQDYLQDFQIYT